MRLSIKVNKYSAYKILIILIIIFVPINLLKDLFPFPITLINGGAILFVLLYLNVKHLKKKTVFIIMITTTLFVINIFVTDDLSRHFRYFFNWISLIYVLDFLSYSKNIDELYMTYQKNHKSIKKLVIVCWVIFGVLLLLPVCYSGGWWGLSGGFVAFTVSHAVAAAACTLGVISLFLWYDGRHNFIPFMCLAVAVYIILQTGARTYVLSIVFLVLYYMHTMIKNPYVKSFIFIVAIVACVIIVPNSSFAEKNDIVMTYQDINGVSLLNALTSGRTLIWATDIKYYVSNGLYLFLFGNGFATSYAANRAYYYGMDIFSHNLFIETLLSAGVIGGVILIYLLKVNIKNNLKMKSDRLLVFCYMIIIGVC